MNWIDFDLTMKTGLKVHQQQTDFNLPWHLGNTEMARRCLTLSLKCFLKVLKYSSKREKNLIQRVKPQSGNMCTQRVKCMFACSKVFSSSAFISLKMWSDWDTWQWLEQHSCAYYNTKEKHIHQTKERQSKRRRVRNTMPKTWTNLMVKSKSSHCVCISKF